MPDLGTKYQCASCGTKFYDLGQADATCPKCGLNPLTEEIEEIAEEEEAAEEEAAEEKPAADEEAAGEPQEDEDDSSPDDEEDVVSDVDLAEDKAEDEDE